MDASTEGNTALVWFDQARQALMQAKSIDEVKELRDQAEALRLYHKQATDGLEMQNWCAEIKLRAERRAGELLREVPREQGKRTDVTSLEGQTKLRATIDHLDISTETAHRWQAIATLPEADFETYIAHKKATGYEVTSAGAYHLAQRIHVPDPVDTPPYPSGRFRCLVIDPPWPTQRIIRQERPLQPEAFEYAIMPMDEIEALPIAALAEPDGCHIYLWVTHHFLPKGLQLFEGWGVKYQCQLTWVKNVGVTPFSWMYDTEHVLFGRIGHLDLLQNGLRLSFSEAVQGHSVKPDVFYERVRAASPGPRLEMFARSSHEGFQPWGAEAPTDAADGIDPLDLDDGPTTDTPHTPADQICVVCSEWEHAGPTVPCETCGQYRHAVGCGEAHDYWHRRQARAEARHTT